MPQCQQREWSEGSICNIERLVAVARYAGGISLLLCSLFGARHFPVRRSFYVCFVLVSVLLIQFSFSLHVLFEEKMEGLRPVWAVKVIMVIVIGSIFFRCVSARNYTVGGPNGWDLASNLGVWSRSVSFYTGDNLVFSYTPDHDVLEVNQLDFARCRNTNPITTHRDGETVVPLTNAGTRFFICGRRGHCIRGLRVMVQVSDRTSAAPASPPGRESAPSEPARKNRPPPPGKGNNSSSTLAMGEPPANSPVAAATANSSVGAHTGGWVWRFLAVFVALVMVSDLLSHP